MISQKFKYILRIVVQLTFFALFVLFFLRGFLQLWLVIFAVGVVGSVVFGRFYCGWLCPMNTLARPIRWVYNKLGRTRAKPPSLLRSGWGRWFALVALLVSMFYMRITGIQFPVLLIVTAISFGFFSCLKKRYSINIYVRTERF